MIQALGFPYFWFCVVLMLGSALTRWVLYFQGSTHYSLWDVWVSTLFAPVLIPYYGLLVNKAILVPLIWQVLAIFVVVESVRFFFTDKMREAYEKVGVRKAIIAFGLVAILALPPTVAVVQYAFFSGHIFAGG